MFWIRRRPPVIGGATSMQPEHKLKLAGVSAETGGNHPPGSKHAAINGYHSKNPAAVALTSVVGALERILRDFPLSLGFAARFLLAGDKNRSRHQDIRPQQLVVSPMVASAFHYLALACPPARLFDGSSLVDLACYWRCRCCSRDAACCAGWANGGERKRFAYRDHPNYRPFQSHRPVQPDHRTEQLSHLESSDGSELQSHASISAQNDRKVISRFLTPPPLPCGQSDGRRLPELQAVQN